MISLQVHYVSLYKCKLFNINSTVQNKVDPGVNHHIASLRAGDNHEKL